MTSRRAIKGILHNFLGTYTSRYSDYDGYWLFGMLVTDLTQLNLDLLDFGGSAPEITPVSSAAKLATAEFKDQVQKAGLSLSCIQSAHLTITKSLDPSDGQINGCPCVGYDVSFMATAVSDHGKTYKHEKSVFVAPHDSKVERRSVRGT